MDGIDKLNLLSPAAAMPNAPRIAPLEPPYAADVAAALSRIHPSDSPREPLKLFRTMVRSPRLCDPMFAFARFMLGRNTRNRRQLRPADARVGDRPRLGAMRVRV